jgi:release factor glutamine methyltransferase
VTVLEAIQKSTDFLGKKSVESPRLQTELLLAHLLNLPRMNLYLNFERVLTSTETDRLREAVKRRGQREPLQHVIGSVSFCGFEIAVNRNALVPRPETELLAETGWTFLNQISEGRVPQVPNQNLDNADPPRSSLRVLDFGTGTGCIAIALVKKCPQATIVALDLSTEAIVLAKNNAAKNNVADRIECVPGKGFEALEPEGRVPRVLNQNLVNKAGNSQSSPLQKFDLIISNPPYIPTAEIETLEPEVKDFDPRGALDGGADGLDFYRMFARQAKSFLKTDGKIMLEFGEGQAEAIRKLFEDEKWIVETVKEDYSHRARILVAKSSSSSAS